jgi:hypothetical protein
MDDRITDKPTPEEGITDRLTPIRRRALRLDEESGQDPAIGWALGCLAVALGLFLWVFAIDPPSSREASVHWREMRLYEAAVFGIGGAVVVGLGLWVARRQPWWVGWVAVAIGGLLVFGSLLQIVRWR